VQQQNDQEYNQETDRPMNAEEVQVEVIVDENAPV